MSGYVLEDRVTATNVELSAQSGALATNPTSLDASPEPIIKDADDENRWKIFISDGQLGAEPLVSTADDVVELTDTTTGGVWRLAVVSGQIQLISVNLVIYLSEYQSFIKSKHYVGEIGTKLTMNTGIDVTGAVTVEIGVRKPDGTEETWPCEVFQQTKISHIIEDGDFNIPGLYKFRAHVESSGIDVFGETLEIYVYDEFDGSGVTQSEASAEQIPAHFGSGNKEILAPGTPRCLVDVSTPCREVILSADTGNQTITVFGDENANAADGEQNGTVLFPGNDPVTFKISNLNKIFVDGQTAGDKVLYSFTS